MLEELLLQSSAPDVTSLEQLALWAGTAGMALGTLAFIGMGWGEDDPKKQEYYIITIFIPAIAAVSYFSMAMGYGSLELVVGSGAEEAKRIYWARYADWLFTTPLLLLDLALLAGADRNTIATLIGLDVGMILTGLVAALTSKPAVEVANVETFRIAWWGISTGFMVVLLYFLVSTLSQKAAEQPGEVGSVFTTLRNLTIVLWSAYPILWLVGTEGLGIVGLGPETVGFAILDLTAKVGFGFILLNSRSAINAAASRDTAAAAD